MDKIYLPNRFFDLKLFTKNFLKLEFWLVASIFLDAYKIEGLGLPFEFYYYYIPYIIYLIKPIQQESPRLNLNYTKGLTIIIALSFVAATFMQYPYFLVIKQAIAITFVSLVFIKFLKHNLDYIQDIFTLFFMLSIWISIHAIVQEIAWILGAGFGYAMLYDNGFYRVWGIMGEPYFLASVLTPALYYGISQYLDSNQKKYLLASALILMAIIFTFSTTAITILPLIPLMLLLENKKTRARSLQLALLISAVILFLKPDAVNFSSVEEKLNDSLLALNRDVSYTDYDPEMVINSSSFAWYSNLIIALKSVEISPILGSGIGTHPVNFERFFDLYFPREYHIIYGDLNSKDANSLLNRLLSETGYLGITLFILFTLVNLMAFRANAETPKVLVKINIAIFIFLVMRLLRTGNYISQAFPLFLVLYELTAKRSRQSFTKPKTIAAQENEAA